MPDLLARAGEAWARKSSPAPVLQALQDRLGPASEEETRAAFAAAIAPAGCPEAQGIVAGGIRALFEARLAGDPSLVTAMEHAFAAWPLTARILYAIRLLRAAGGGPVPADVLAGVRGLIAAPEADPAVPLQMRHGFLMAAAASDRLPPDTRETALATADRLLARSEPCIPPSVVLRLLARAAAANRASDPRATARKTVKAAGIAGAVADPLLVHVATLALARETGIALPAAHALLHTAAQADPRWSHALRAAFDAALTDRTDGLLCRDLLATPPAKTTATAPLAEPPAPARRKSGTHRKPKAEAPPAEPAPPPEKPARQSLARQATKHASTLLKRLRRKGGDAEPGRE